MLTEREYKANKEQLIAMFNDKKATIVEKVINILEKDFKNDKNLFYRLYNQGSKFTETESEMFVSLSIDKAEVLKHVKAQFYLPVLLPHQEESGIGNAIAFIGEELIEFSQIPGFPEKMTPNWGAYVWEKGQW